MGQKTGNPGSNTEGICLQVNLATESGLTASLGPQVPRMPFRGLLMVQGANTRLHEVSTWPADSFPPSKPCKTDRGHPSRAHQARPALQPLPVAKGHLHRKAQLVALPGVRSRLPIRPGSPSNRLCSAPQRPPQPGSRPPGVPHLLGFCRPWALTGDRETRLEKASPPLALRNVLTGCRRLLACAAVTWGGRQGRGAFWEAGRLGSSDVTPGAPFPVRKPGLLAWSERSALGKARLEAGRRSSQGRREVRLAAATLSAAVPGRWKAEGWLKHSKTGWHHSRYGRFSCKSC